MAVLSKATIQRLAVLRALSMWQSGAYGPVRLQKTLFFADKENEPEWRLFTFKKWRLGQYSDEIAGTLNELRCAGRISSVYDGPSERIRAILPVGMKAQLNRFFKKYFREWNNALADAFKTWAYLSNDDIVQKAHDDPSYTKSKHGDTIFRSFQSPCVEFSKLDDKMAENLSDLVDARFQSGLVDRLMTAADREVKSEDWRRIYFGEQQTTAGSG